MIGLLLASALKYVCDSDREIEDMLREHERWCARTLKRLDRDTERILQDNRAWVDSKRKAYTAFLLKEIKESTDPGESVTAWIRKDQLFRTCSNCDSANHPYEDRHLWEGSGYIGCGKHRKDIKLTHVCRHFKPFNEREAFNG